jgi:predicted site-specific integrase-resolvase
MDDDDGLDWERALETWSAEAGHEWVTLAEAERRAGVSRSALRSWFRTGQLPSRLADGPHGMQRLVPLSAVLERAGRSPRIQRRLESAVGVEAELALLRQRVEELERRVARLEGGSA